MNADTVTLIDRPYQEIVDDVLTSILGGVVNEPIIFDVKEDLYHLAQPAASLRSITGTAQAEHVEFQGNVDYVFDTASNAVVWQTGGKKPDDETEFYVDYILRDSRSLLTDVNVGSVTRTLSEAISREIAIIYQQINEAYKAGFVDTAKGQSLDLVVSILGITRKTKDFASGMVTFYRATGEEGNISIGQGLKISTAKGKVFETCDMRTLQRGQARIDVPIRAAAGFKGQEGIVGANEITTLSQPLNGIDHVTNLEPTLLAGEDETDEQLRARAKAVLRGLGKATIAALSQAINNGGAQLDEVWDPNNSPTATLGSVTLLVETKPERFMNVQASVHETRAAGVQATMVARYIFFKPRLIVNLTRTIAGDGKLKVISDVIAALQAYMNGLKAGDPATGEGLIKSLKEVKDISLDGNNKPKIVDVMAWKSDIGQPGAQSLVDALLAAYATTPPNDARALREAFTRVVNDAPSFSPSSRRVPDRTLVQGPSGQRATDTDFDKGVFKIVPPDTQWTVVLDIEPTDIVLTQKS